MFDQLFKQPCALLRHRNAPLASERASFLAQRAEGGAAPDTSVFTDVQRLIERHAKGDGLWQLFAGHLFPIHGQGCLSTFADTAAVVDKIEGNGMAARFELIFARYRVTL